MRAETLRRNPMTFAPRAVASLGIVRGAWAAKLYAIRSARWRAADLPARAVLAEAVRAAMDTLDAPRDHPLGFAILHMADDGTYLLLSRFNDANNLRHRVFAATPAGARLELAPLADPHVVCCVWEMRVMMGEADAWIDAVLRPGAGLTAAAQAAYLARRFEGEA